MARTSYDYYEVLEVDRTADGDEIKRSFRRLARKYHPDVSNEPNAEDQFKLINEAYDVLSDPEKRSNYDRFGSAGGPNMGGGAGGYQYYDMGDMGVDLGDLFSAFFGGVAGSRGGARVRLEGRDMQMTVSVTLEEAATGVKKEIVVDRLAPCDFCDATGAATGTESVTCPDCNGQGVTVGYRNTFLGAVQTQNVCEKCHGTGTYTPTPCPECEGSGRLYDRQTVHIEIPAGIASGQQMRVRERGEAGIRGARSGDLLVTIVVRDHKDFERHGDDLHARLKVSISEASLGANVKAKTLLGETTAQVIAGAQHGDVIKIKGEGMPRLRSDVKGDLYYHLQIEIPKNLSDRARELLSELSLELGDTKEARVGEQKLSFFERLVQAIKSLFA